MIDLPPVPLHHEGADLVGRIAMPAGEGPHPALLVMHNAHGLNPYMIEVASRLATLGYVAVATDMYGGGAHAADQAGAGALLGPLWRDQALLRRRAVAWFDHLGTLPGVDPKRRGALGYCFGGQCVLEIARAGTEACALVGYHALLTTHARAPAGGIRSPVAIHTGTDDPWAPYTDVVALREELSAGGNRWQITEYGRVKHGFAEPHDGEPSDGIAYDSIADQASWAATLALLAETMAP